MSFQVWVPTVCYRAVLNDTHLIKISNPPKDPKELTHAGLQAQELTVPAISDSGLGKLCIHQHEGQYLCRNMTNQNHINAKLLRNRH